MTDEEQRVGELYHTSFFPATVDPRNRPPIQQPANTQGAAACAVSPGQASSCRVIRSNTLTDERSLPPVISGQPLRARRLQIRISRVILGISGQQSAYPEA